MASEFQLRQAASILLDGGIISYQTNTLYGLCCDPYNQQAVQRLNAMKHRQDDKTFILLANTLIQLIPLIHPDEISKKQTILDTPNTTSWVVKASDTSPDWLKANDNTIAIRLSDDPITKRLCQKLGRALVSTSANISGRRPANNALQCRKIFGNQAVDMMMTANHTFSGKPSRLLRLCDNKVLRP